MTKLEMQAIALANELEQSIKYGTKVNLNVIQALRAFRAVHAESESQLTSDLDGMYKAYLNSVGALPENIILFTKKD